MNSEFIKKIVKAEKLKYEAIKELLPDNLKDKTERLEKEALSLLKDIAIEIINDTMEEEKYENKKTTKKVNVDFS